MKILSVVGTRPNFVKTAPVVAEIAKRDGLESVLVHTGQHYDEAMSTIFFEQLGVGTPDHMLGVSGGTHTQVIAGVMQALEPVLEAERPDLVLVPGDVNSTLAATLTALKTGIPVAHLEAGLRSFDRTMPEETNRVLTDAVAEVLLTHSPEAKANLIREGRSALDVFEVGNTMIDSLLALRERFDSSSPRAALGVEGDYLLVTLHRPALVDGELLGDAIAALNEVAAEIPVVFPVHPRTRIRMNEENLTPAPGLHLAEPLGYLEFMGLVEKAKGVLTDSGGVQEETTVLGIPCFTLRDNTERPVTVSQGTNTLLGLDPARIREVPKLITDFQANSASAPAGWDGKASVRTVDVLEAFPDSRR